jgi:hypothetical protein
MGDLGDRFSSWVVAHPVLWAVGSGLALVLLGLALELPPILVVVAATGIAALNIRHARRRGYCPLPADDAPAKSE